MANILLNGNVYTGAGVAVQGATVELLARNTVTPVLTNGTYVGGTTAAGLWNFSFTPPANRRIDVRITNGTSVSFLKYDDQMQVSSVETASLRVINPAFSYVYDIVPAAITADRQLNLPLITGTATLATIDEGVKGADIASGATLTLVAGSDFADVTGTTTVTAISTRPAGSRFTFQFDGALTLTHNATTLILQGAVNLVTAAGDVLRFISEGGGNWREEGRRLAAASGAPTAGQYVVLAVHADLSAERVLTGTANQITITDGGANGDVTLSTPQSIATGSAPQFARMGLGVAADATKLFILDESTTAANTFEMRASTDVAHGMTNELPTNAYASFKRGATSGGLRILGVRGGGSADGLTLVGVGADATTRATLARAPVVITGSKISAASIADTGADSNILGVGVGNTAGSITMRFFLDSDGDSHQDVGTAWTTFDDHDDLALLNTLAAHVTRPDDPIREQFGDWLKERREPLERMKLVTFNEDGHHFVNMSRLSMLNVGAIRQMGRQLERLELAINTLQIQLNGGKDSNERLIG